MKMRNLHALVIALLTASPAMAHPSEQGLVLLLPTTLYTLTGVTTVALTIVLTTMISSSTALRLFIPLNLPRLMGSHYLLLGLSLCSFLMFMLMIWFGFTGPSDPLTNPLTLMVWTVMWLILPVLHAIFGNLWIWLNPWAGVYYLLQRRKAPPLTLPAWLGYSPAIVIFLLFTMFALADPAPDQPARLALVVAIYWVLTMIGMLLFGEVWLKRGEGFGVFFGLMAQLSPFRYGSHAGIGMPGWRILHRPVPPFTLALFAIVILACGSFDGLNETFWWLSTIGINPLAFPGRSAVIWETITGLLVMNVLLILVFFLTCVAGWFWAGRGAPFRVFFLRMSLTLLPIAIGYHIAHFLPSFLVNIQYVVVVLSDPLATGANYLNLGEYYVSTGFFNRTDTVHVIYLTQVTAVVLGHVCAIMLSHGVAVQTFDNPPDAFKSQIPMALLMIAYTFLGLWLLATPRGF